MNADEHHSGVFLRVNPTTDTHPEQSRRATSMAKAIAVLAGPDGLGKSPTPQLRRLICPFCGAMTSDSGRCASCHARFDPLSRQASQNEMGPWFVRDSSSPHRPGCNYSTIKRLIENKVIEPNSVLRGPSTRQFWMLAKHVPGVSQLLGVCHNCGADVATDAFACGSCHETFSTDRDRQHLGLGPMRPLPGMGDVQLLAMRAEPAKGAEQVSGPSAIPLSPREERDQRSGGRRISDGDEEAVQSKSDAGLDAIKQVDELSRAVRALRRAWLVERKRSWIAVACAGLVCAFAMVVIMVRL